MKETTNNETCCEKSCAAPSCSCSSNNCDCGKPISRKPLKIILCLAVFIAAVSIIAYRMVSANRNGGIPSYGTTRALSMLNFIPKDSFAVNFIFGQPASESTSAKENTIQAQENLGAYVESLNELNIVAAGNDVIFVYVPNTGNVLVDKTTKEAFHDFQKNLKRNDLTSGLYTLWHDSPDYAEIAKQGKLPAIIVACYGAGTSTVYGSGVSEYTLFKAYQAAAFGDCCVISSSDCCGW